jgi:succinate-acetate transporter protein
MRSQDYLGLTVFVGFGLWWALFPNSVIRFYLRFLPGRVPTPNPLTVRIVGVLWVVLVLGVTLHRLR